jgi:hypothetical protein
MGGRAERRLGGLDEWGGDATQQGEESWTESVFNAGPSNSGDLGMAIFFYFSFFNHYFRNEPMKRFFFKSGPF